MNNKKLSVEDFEVMACEVWILLKLKFPAIPSVYEITVKNIITNVLKNYFGIGDVKDDN